MKCIQLHPELKLGSLCPLPKIIFLSWAFTYVSLISYTYLSMYPYIYIYIMLSVSFYLSLSHIYIYKRFTEVLNAIGWKRLKKTDCKIRLTCLARDRVFWWYSTSIKICQSDFLVWFFPLFLIYACMHVSALKAEICICMNRSNMSLAHINI